LPDSDTVHAEWRRLVVIHSVVGMTVHDAPLAAAMHVPGGSHGLTLDEKISFVTLELPSFTLRE
jgi:hypothetical protein